MPAIRRSSNARPLAVLLLSTLALASCAGKNEEASGPSPQQVAAETRAAEQEKARLEAEQRARDAERRRDEAAEKASASEQKATTFGAGGLIFGFVTFILGIVIGARTRKHAERRHEERP